MLVYISKSGVSSKMMTPQICLVLFMGGYVENSTVLFFYNFQVNRLYVIPFFVLILDLVVYRSS